MTDREFERLCTPLTEEEVHLGLQTGLIPSPIMFRIIRRSVRSDRGKRLFDIEYDTDTRKYSITCKQEDEITVIPAEELMQKAKEMKTE